MILEENELKISLLEEKLVSLEINSNEYIDLCQKIDELKKETYGNLTSWDRVCLARSEKRIKSKVLINNIIDDFFELHGDQYYGDDKSIIGGIGFLVDIPVTIIAQVKGTNTIDNIERNFGMTSPEGFRKAFRLAKEAEKFSRPIITIVDTPGAYPGKDAEERGQARAIANNLLEFSKLNVPVISIILSEGGSGGALALTVSDFIFMFENAIYSVLSPEGFNSILFKNKMKLEDVSEIMKLTSNDLYELGVIDEIIKEPIGGIRAISRDFSEHLKLKVYNKIIELSNLTKEELLSNRFNKYRNIR